MTEGHSESGVGFGRGRRAKKSLTIAMAAVCVLAVGASVFFYQKYQSSQDTAQAKQQKVLERLGETIALPGGSSTAVTVVDKSKLSNKTLANRVQNQDVLFIFGESKRIIVYRPASEKVVDMLTFASSDDLSGAQAEQAPSAPTEETSPTPRTR